MKRMLEPVMYHGHPAINVKVQTLPQWPSADELVKCEKITLPEAEKALQTLWDNAVASFWEDAERLGTDYFSTCQVGSEGRSGGWLIVQGIGDPDTWSKGERTRWEMFAMEIHDAITLRSSAEWVNIELADILEFQRDAAKLGRMQHYAPELNTALDQIIKCYDVFTKHASIVSSPDSRWQGMHSAIEEARALRQQIDTVPMPDADIDAAIVAAEVRAEEPPRFERGERYAH